MAPSRRGAEPPSSELAVGLGRVRFALLATGMLALLAAMAGGLVRLGIPLPVPERWAVIHGPLVVTGFLGTLIGLERAIGLGGLAWAAPCFTVASAVALVADRPMPEPAVLAAIGSAASLAVFARLLRRQPEPFLAVMALGSFAWLVGNLLWCRDLPIHRVAPWWAAFPTLVIAGERLAATRLRPPSARANALCAAAIAVVIGGLAASLLFPDRGFRVAGVGLVALALFLLRHDVARRNLHAEGLPRFMAAALLIGYAWLAFAGVLWALLGATEGGALYDAALHGVFLGFVFAMIVAHAPVIFPSVLGVRSRYSPTFFVPLGILEATIVLRIAGDLLESAMLRRWGAIANGIAIVLFLANMARVLLRRDEGP